jgi:hexosaminidase
MHSNRLLSLLVFICIVFSCNTVPLLETITPNIIPVPLKQELHDGQFILSSETALQYDDAFKVSAKFLESYIANSSQIKLKEGNGENTIVFIKDTLLSNKEEYTLKVLPEAITITAATDAGAFYAVQSLRQLLPVEFENGAVESKRIGIQSLTIEDVPQFVYRGMHLDVGRHFFSVDFIKRYIDALALLKMNTFHWHLTEDQGWRIEIKKYPKLNEIAAFRNETLIGHYNDQPHQFDGKKYGGYYTQEQIKELVKYASNRKITIIPEIEMPGHSQAAISAYPELGCTGSPIEVATKWGVFEEIYCTKEETFTFLEDVLDEVLELFPSQYIHIGGDEAPKTRWKTCNDCQQRIKAEDLKDEHELQSYFISRMERYLNSKGRQIIGWDEILEGGLAPNATVMSWRGTKGAVEAAKAKHTVINTPTSHSYFDYYQSTNEGEPVAIGGFLPLEKVYSFNPIPKELNADEQQYVLGAQGNVWSEYMSTEDQVEYMVFPRILAMSEVVWSNPENKNYADFISRVEVFNKRLDALGVNYANHLYEVEGELLSEKGNLSYQLNTLTKDKAIRYTLDGSAPLLTSETYSESIKINGDMLLKAAVFNTEEQLGSVYEQKLDYHKAVDKEISLNVEPHKAYSGSGKNGMINGINGSDNRFGDKEWLGFWGDDLEITIDLGEITEINTIETRFYNANGQWLYVPGKVGIAFDALDFEYYEVNNEGLIIDFKVDSFNNIKARKINIKIPNYGIIPEGLQGAGNKAWTFIDEIIVK